MHGLGLPARLLTLSLALALALALAVALTRSPCATAHPKPDPSPSPNQVFLRDCVGCTFSVAAKQLRLRNVLRSEVRYP